MLLTDIDAVARAGITAAARARRLTVKEPKPRISTRSPRANLAAISRNMASTAACTSL